MTSLDAVYAKLVEVGNDVAALKLHVLGNGGPGLSERLRDVEELSIKHNGMVERLAVEVPKVSDRMAAMEAFETKEHATARTMGLATGYFLGCVGLVASLWKAVN